MQIVRIGLDLAKYVFEVHGVDAEEKVALRKTLRREAVASFFADYPEEQSRGITTYPGLYFCGLHSMHTLKSGLFFGVGEDAEHVTGHLLSRLNGLAHAGRTELQ